MRNLVNMAATGNATNAAAASGAASAGMAQRAAIVCLAISVVYCVAYYGYYFLVSVGYQLDSQPRVGGDFFVFYAAALLVGDGGLASLYDMLAFSAFQDTLRGGSGVVHPFPYPPHFLAAVEWLRFLPFLAAYAVWEGLGLALYLIALRQLRVTGLMLAAALVAPAVLTNLLAGQLGFVSAGLLLAGFALLDRRPVLAGIVFGLLTVKPHLGVLVPLVLLVQGRWPTVAAAVATTVALAGASMAFYGVDLWADYIGFLGAYPQVSEINWDSPFGSVVASPFLSAMRGGAGLTGAYAAQAVAACGAIAAVVWIARRRPPVDLLAAGVAAATLLVSPVGYLYDFTLLTGAVLVVLRCHLFDGPRPMEVAILLAGWWWPVVARFLNEGGLPLAWLGPVLVLAAVMARVAAAESVVRSAHGNSHGNAHRNSHGNSLNREQKLA